MPTVVVSDARTGAVIRESEITDEQVREIESVLAPPEEAAHILDMLRLSGAQMLDVDVFSD